MRIKDILNDSEYYCVYDVKDLEFKKIAYRINDMDKDCVFFFIKGKSFNTEKTLAAIAENNPVCIIADENYFTEHTNIPILITKNVRAALSFAYSRFYGISFDALKFVGVTGTNGKTTTATMIKAILEAEEKKVGFIGTGKIESAGNILTTYDYSMTTPDPDLLYFAVKRMQEDGCEYIVMEVSSHALALEKTAPIYFEATVFTNLSHEHLDFHSDIESYYHTKMNLFEQSKLGIFNIDDEYGRRGFSECKCDKKSIGILWDADVRAKEPKLKGFYGSSYLYRAKDFIFRMNLPLVGAYNIYNSLAAITVTHSLGCRPCVAKSTLESILPPAGRFEIIEDSICVIIDYAHTPYAVENILKTINSSKNPEQNLITVFGCGGERDRSKRPIMGSVSEEMSDFTVITEDNSRGEDKEQIINDILSGISDKSRCAVIASRAEAIESAIINAPDGAVIAILGKGAERYNIDKKGFHPFDEREVIKTALEKRRAQNES